jgi:uncharacterized protein with ATP-grasp and redox domains
MTPNEIIIQQFLETVDNQLRDNDPVETAQTLARLQAEGYSEKEAKYLIAQCVAKEVIDVLNSGQPFNEKRYVTNLHRLPEEPE